MIDPLSLSGPSPWEEKERLKAIDAYEILDTPIEEEFDDIAKMAAQALNVPVSMVSFVAKEKQFFKAKVGIEIRETPRDLSICAHAIQQPGLFVIPDLTQDERFLNHPFVAGDPGIRFYAGALLETAEGLPLGTMCVIDYKPRALTEQEGFVLKALARQVMVQLDLRRALKAKQKSEERLTLALESSGCIGTWDLDLIQDRIYADPRFVALFGGSPSWSKEGAPMADYVRAVHAEDRARFLAHVEEVRVQGGLFQDEYRLIQADGSVRWIEARGRCRLDDAGQPLSLPGVAVDITERKAGEEAARDALERFRIMAETMPQKIFTARPDGSIDYLNAQWFDFTGLGFEQIRNWGWTQLVHPDDLPENLRRWRKALTDCSPYEMERRFRRQDGGYRWHLSRAVPMRDAHGDVLIWIGSDTDIDDQRRLNENLERTVAERTVALQDTISELESFSYSISHDMRAPLRAMLGFANILQEDYGSQLDETANHYLGRISAASSRMDGLIQDVLSFSQMSRQDPILEPINSGRLIHEILETYPNLQPTEVEVNLEEPLPRVMANQAALTQCISNILGNAVKFVAPGVKPRVRVWGEPRADFMRLWFKDNGIGIAAENQKRIFEIFYRINRDREGTGIGLAIVKKAVERMGGHIGFESRTGEGTAFWLDLQGA